MHIELLSRPPISGSVVERHFDAPPEANAWVVAFQETGLLAPAQPDACVLFDDEQGQKWVGVFGSSPIFPFRAAVPFPDDSGRTVLVVSGGQGYVVDAVNGSLVRQTPWDDAHAAVPVPGHDFVLVTNDIYLWAAGRAEDRYAWRQDTPYYCRNASFPAPRVALDGIVFDSMTLTEVTGKVWEGDGWYAFRLRLPDLAFVRGAYLTPKWEMYAGSTPAD